MPQPEMIQGSLVALVTPMLLDGRLDIPAYKALIDFHIQQGTDGIVVVGTTGESATIDISEHCLLIETAVAHAEGRIPIIAGTGANATHEAVMLTREAKRLGVAACLLVTPYYNKPTQEGLYQHFMTIADAVDIPQILYNVPSRTGCDLHNSTALRLAECSRIVGIKDATGDLARGYELILNSPPSFSVYSGDDATALALMVLGARGMVSVTANVAPRAVHDVYMAVQEGNILAAKAYDAKLFALHQALFVQANPIPVKWVLAKMGLIQSGIRLPLSWCDVQYHGMLSQACQKAGIFLDHQ